MLKKGVDDGVFPGAVLLVGRDGRAIFSETVGTRTVDADEAETQNRMEFDTVFDIASLTTLVVTVPLIMKLVEAGQLALQDKVARYIDGFSVFGKSSITIAHLLTHTSGLPAWHPYYEELLKANAGARMGVLTSKGARDYIYTAIKRCKLEFEPGSTQMYSDVGNILLGYLVELLSGMPLDRCARQYLLHPLGMRNSSFIDLAMIKRRGIHPVRNLIAPTENCAWRGRVLCGEVHDDNAWAMGGIAGHSGLFSTAGDLHLFAAEMLRAAQGSSRLLSRDSVKMLWSGVERSDSVTWQHGWDTPGKENNMLASGLSAQAVGACAFTGCSLWLEPEKHVDIVLMSNRIHPNRSNKKIRTFRPQLHEAVLEALGKL
ncbi:MAG: serine hydrolase [Oligoflexia bacterium]|nr:serine hydrolase [Oligoflexia bacterium]